MQYILSMQNVSIAHGRNSVGRPKKFDRVHYLRVSDEWLARLDAYCAEIEMNRSDAIRQIVSQHLEDFECNQSAKD